MGGESPIQESIKQTNNFTGFQLLLSPQLTAHFQYCLFLSSAFLSLFILEDRHASCYVVFLWHVVLNSLIGCAPVPKSHIHIPPSLSHSLSSLLTALPLKLKKPQDWGREGWVTASWSQKPKSQWIETSLKEHHIGPCCLSFKINTLSERPGYSHLIVAFTWTTRQLKVNSCTNYYTQLCSSFVENSEAQESFSLTHLSSI